MARQDGRQVRPCQSWRDQRRFVLCVWLTLVGTAALASGQTPPPQITGVVVDATDAALPSAEVDLTRDGNVTASVQTGPGGGFTFPSVPPGRYQLRIVLDGFRPTTADITVGARPPKPLRITLALAEIHEEVTVTNNSPRVSDSAAANADAVTVNQDTLENVPILNDDAIGTLSRFLDSGSLGTGGVALFVNGLPIDSLNVTTSEIQQLKINQDPYSAVYARPGRGRIDIITKAATATYHGEGTATVRDGHLDARNAFASERPAEQRLIGDGVFGGPVGHSGSTSFLASVSSDVQERQAFVFATGLEGRIQDAVSQPYRHLLASIALTHQHGTSTFSIRPSYQDETDAGRGVGGTTLASAGTTFHHRETNVTYTQQTVLRPTLVNQLQAFVGHESQEWTSASSASGLVVNGAFTGGGAQVDVQRPELHLHLSDNLALTRGAHLLQMGVQVPDWTRRGIDDRSQDTGTYYFSGLSAYAARQPYAFLQQRGAGHVVFLEKVLGLYANDDWQAWPGATLSLGVRYDWSNYFADHDTVAPRLSLAVKPTKSGSTVIRAGAGIFYDKVGPVPVMDVLESRPGGIDRILVSHPPYPFVGSGAPQPLDEVPSTTQLAPGIQVPWTLQYSAGLERQLTKTATLSITYHGSASTLLRSRDVNAPLPPLYMARPDPAFGVIRQIESSGRQRSNDVQLMLRGRSGRRLSGQVQYTLSQTLNNSGGLDSFPANDYDLSGEWGRADFDRRHQLLLLGNATLGRQVTLGVALTLASGLPYTELLGGDPFNNGRGNARPAGVDRNTLQGAGSTDLDVRLAREFPLAQRSSAPRMSIAIDAFNVLNHVNYTQYESTATSLLFGQPVSAAAPRQLQLSARLKF